MRTHHSAKPGGPTFRSPKSYGLSESGHAQYTQFDRRLNRTSYSGFPMCGRKSGSIICQTCPACESHAVLPSAQAYYRGLFSVRKRIPYSYVADVRSWLQADIQRRAVRGLLSARKRTLANRISQAAHSTSAYRSKADVGNELAQCLLLTQSGHWWLWPFDGYAGTLKPRNVRSSRRISLP